MILQFTSELVCVCNACGFELFQVLIDNCDTNAYEIHEYVCKCCSHLGKDCIFFNPLTSWKMFSIPENVLSLYETLCPFD